MRTRRAADVGEAGSFMRAGSNLPAVGGYNYAVILDAVRHAVDGVSRIEVAKNTGLSAQTVTNIVRRLMDEGLVVEDGTRVNGVGKPRTILRLAPRARFAIGIHLDPSVVTLVLLDLAGEVVARRELLTASTARAEETVERIAAAIPAMLKKQRIEPGRVLGAGVAAPGPIDVTHGIVLDPPLLPGWRNVPVRSVLSDRLGMPVLLEKDVTAAVIAELWLDSTGASDDIVFFYAGTGVGAGLAIGGEAIRGSSGNAGGIGWLDTMRFDGVSHPTTWPVGDALRAPFLIGQAIIHGLLPGDPSGLVNGDASGMAITELRSALADLMMLRDDPRAKGLFTLMFDGIADAIVRLVNLLDVDRVVFGGPFIAPIGQVLLEVLPGRVRASVRASVPHDIEFVISSAGEAVAARGAACLVLDDTLSPKPQDMLIRRPVTAAR
ncbi:ROK family transcriptional regulator [Humibacter ginsengiterrae]